MRPYLSFVIVACALCLGAARLAAQTPAANAATPQGKVVLAYYKAAHAGDLAELKKCITAESAKELEGPHGKEILGMLKEMTPAVTPAITKVAVTGKTAVVDAQLKEGATTTTDHHKLVLVGTDWKIDTTGK